ncbi:MAG: leucine-rich repeat domain-containing protein, partial [Clostridia bacterium]|nr:leucine-rich repeat domain-containing protein [Clostridia bacterium]
IPSTYQGLPVTKIAMGAFEGSAIPVEVIIPHSVYLIDTESFRNCVNLESVYIPNSVTIIGDAVFQECPKIKSFEIPASVQRIGIGAFSAGAGLESITVGLGNPSYYSKNNCLIERETGRLISGCSNSTIPDEVKIIGYIAFQGCVDMKEAIIPEGVVAIHEMAFLECTSLEYASLPSTLRTMEGFVFDGCSSLREVVIAEGVKEIGLCAFYGTAITELRIPESVTKLGSQFAEGCKKLKTVYLPKGLITIGISAFEDCKALKSVYYSGTVQQWHAVTKDVRWDANTASYKVYCSDGEIKK